MKIIHRIGLSNQPDVLPRLVELGLTQRHFKSTSGLLINFDVAEDDPIWPEVRVWAESRKPSHMVTTTFSASDMALATCFLLRPTWHWAYPGPDVDNNGYHDATYVEKEICGSCGAGMRQVAPFQFVSNPKWKGRGVVQTNWVFDEFFLAPSVYREVFAPLGIASRPVLNYKGVVLDDIVQLVVDEAVAADDKAIGLAVPHPRCDACARVKFEPWVRGFFPPPLSPLKGHIARTEQWFGSGHSAFHEIVVSRDLAQALIARKEKGVRLWPVAPGA